MGKTFEDALAELGFPLVWASCAPPTDDGWSALRSQQPPCQVNHLFRKYIGLEIALRHASDAYRVVVAVQISRRIYVLHAFQKKSKKGIETPKRDVELIRQRYAEARELENEFEKTKTN